MEQSTSEHILTVEYTSQQLTVKWPQQQLNFKTNQSLTVAQNQRFIVATLGEVRGYQQDRQQNDANTLLAIINDDFSSYYSKIAGFFGAVIIDKSSDNIYLVSDHMGSVGLYYHQAGGEINISNTLSQMNVSSFEINPQAIFNYCYFHCIPAPITIYRDVFKVEAGHQVSINAQGDVESELLYQPQYNYSSEPDQALYQQCQTLVAQAVKRHAGSQSGAFLSGGLDSSTVAGMLAKEQPHAKTFSIGFDEKQYDETAYALITAEHFKTDHQVLKLQSEALIKNFKQIAGYFDEPFGNSSAMAAFACASFAKEHGVTRMLAGDGGDEIFAGNERYAKQKVFEHYTNSPKIVQQALSGLFCHTPLQKLPIGSKAASYIRQAKEGLPDRLESYNFVNRFELSTMFEDEFLAQVDVKQPLAQKRQRYQQAKSDNPIEQMLFLDWKFTLADNDLVKVSKMCEMAGVEVRYPLLEKELVDFTTTLSPDQKLPKQQLRDFYKKAFGDFLAPETLAKSKHGFGLPFGAWMKQSDELMSLAKSALERLGQRKIIKPQFIEQALTMHQSDHADYYGELVWIFVVLELWLEAHQQ